MHHELKIWPQFFDVVRRGDKPFEARKNDRNYTVGDTLVLQEYDPNAPPEGPKYTGRVTEKVVVYVMHGGQFGVEPGYVVLGLR